MPNLYSIQFDVTPAQGQTIQSLRDELEGRVSSWVENKYVRSWNATCTFPPPNQVAQPLAGHTIQHIFHHLDAASIMRIRWVHPDGNDPSMQWTTDVVVALMNDRLQFSLQLGVASMSFVVRPARLTVGRPRIVTEILTSCACRAGARPILTQKQEIGVANVSAFVTEILLDASSLW